MKHRSSPMETGGEAENVGADAGGGVDGEGETREVLLWLFHNPNKWTARSTGESKGREEVRVWGESRKCEPPILKRRELMDWGHSRSLPAGIQVSLEGRGQHGCVFSPALFSFTGTGIEQVENWIFSKSQVTVITDHGIIAGDRERCGW